MSSRIVCKFSCGAASAVATKLTIAKHGLENVEICYSDPGSEHPDNKRFLADCEAWFGKTVHVLRSSKYKDTWDCWESRKFIMSFKGAPCTGYMKREPAYDFDLPSDIWVFGYTVEEKDRAKNIQETNFERSFEFPLIDSGLDKSDCKAMIERAGIQLPFMYQLGYHNNNCIGCPKGGMGYWNKIRRDFPAVFYRMAEMQRRFVSAAFWKEEDGSMLFLDQLDPKRGNHDEEPNVECSLLCVIAEQDIKGPP